MTEATGNAGEITGTGITIVAATVTHHVHHVAADRKRDVLTHILTQADAGQADRAEHLAAAGLQIGGDAENGRGQQVHLIINDQAPVFLVEQGNELRDAGRALPPADAN